MPALQDNSRFSLPVTFSRSTEKLEWDGSSFDNHAVDVAARRLNPLTGAEEWSLEPARTNNLFSSGDLFSADWARFRISNGGSVLAPDGSTISIVAPSTLTGVHKVDQTRPVPSEGRYTASFCFRSAGFAGLVTAMIIGADATNRILMHIECPSGRVVFYTQISVGNFQNPYFHERQTLADGWSRYAVSVDVPESVTSVGFSFSFNDPADYGNISWTGDGVSGAAFWACQVEQGDIPSSPILTPLGATASRAADVLTVSEAQFAKVKGLMGKYGAAIEFFMPESPASNQLFQLSDSSGDEKVVATVQDGADVLMEATSGGSTVGSITKQSTALSRSDGVALLLDGGEMLGAFGLSSAASTSSTTPLVDRLQIGGGDEPLYLKRFRVFGSVFNPPRLATLNTHAQTRHINVLLFGGQSNASGSNNSIDEPPQPTLQDFRAGKALAWDGSKLQRFRMTHTGPNGSGKQWLLGASPYSTAIYGFVDVAAAAIADVVPDLALCGVAEGGTWLALVDNEPSWNTNYEAITGPHKFLQDLEGRWDALVVYCAAQGISVNPIGMLWHQGEGDRVSGRWETYQANLTALIAKVREFTGSPQLPFVYGTVPSSSTSFGQEVQDAHLAIAAGDPNAYCRLNNDLVFNKPTTDTVHWGAASSVTFGTWAANTILAANGY